MNFENIEDEQYFAELLEVIGGLEANRRLFDFRDPGNKRREFNRARDSVFSALVKAHGDSCQLCCHEDCAGVASQVDHLIPLASNTLNKSLRAMKGKEGKKTPPQSFGSNDISNLVLACARCNAFKKNSFPTKDALRYVEAARKGKTIE